MKEGEIEMDKAELQKWIRDSLENINPLSPVILEKFRVLQSLLERREKQTIHLLKLSQSVSACEKKVKELYSLLGLDYKDLGSGDDNEPGSNEYPPSSPSVHSDYEIPYLKKEEPFSPKPIFESNLEEREGKDWAMKNAMVVLEKLTQSQIAATRRKRVPRKSYPTDSSEDSDNDSDFCITEYLNISHKKKKTCQVSETVEKESDRRKQKTPEITKTKTSTPVTNSHVSSKQNVENTPSSKDNCGAEAASNSAKETTSPPGAKDKHQSIPTELPPTPSSTENSVTPLSSVEKTIKPPVREEKAAQANADASAKDQTTKTASDSGNSSGGVTSAPKTSSDTKVTPAKIPLEEVTVDMKVLARKDKLCWELGKITKIVEKDKGKVKYKVNLEEKGRLLLSGHHIAFEHLAKLDQLVIGCRVVIGHKDNKLQFSPGILAELPCRRNRMRFLVFLDDHTPVYVGLPLLHMVCKPLENPLDDISHEPHKNFLMEYLEQWPFPSQTQYKVGQTLNAEHEGTQQKCEVSVIDASLFKVIFQSDQHTEWIYRGSYRLEHMTRMKEWLSSKKR